jgi:site-specific DNA-methyltransferase (adenine-specific)
MDPLPVCACADARDEAAYRGVLHGEKADLLFTDPPYCLLTRRRRGGDLRDARPRKIDRDPVVRFETVRDYRAFSAQWLPLALASLRPAAPAVVWTNFLGKAPLLEVAAAHGYPCLMGEFVWAKRTRERAGNEELLRVYEVALVLAQRPPPPPSPEDLARVWSVVTGYDDEQEGARWGSHPHHKPFGALEPLLRNLSRPGDRVLDPFAGSGSIAAAAMRLGRRPLCLEREPAWAARATERLAELSSPAYPLNSG